MPDKAAVRLARTELTTPRHVCAFFHSGAEHYRALVQHNPFHVPPDPFLTEPRGRAGQAGPN
jgi:hypothetical protein